MALFRVSNIRLVDVSKKKKKKVGEDINKELGDRKGAELKIYGNLTYIYLCFGHC